MSVDANFECQNPLNTSLEEKISPGMISRVVTQRLKNGEFQVEDRIVQRTNTTLFCKFDNRSQIRRFFVRLLENRWFYRAIMVCILLNSLVMSAFDFESDNKCTYEHGDTHCPSLCQTAWNRTLNQIGTVFLWIFTVEAGIKIFALGLYYGKETYLKNGWNVLDFIIVASGLLELTLEQLQFPGVNMRALRMLRLLRPLKAMKTIPSLRKQVDTLLMALRGLANVLIFLSFVFMVFSIVGLQWFSGSTHYACRVGPLQLSDTIWPKRDNFGACTPPQNQFWPAFITSYTKCPANFHTDLTCASEIDYGLNSTLDSRQWDETLQYDIGTFDNFSQALIAVFQIITLDNWQTIMLNLQKTATAPILPSLFCIVLIFLGSFFLLNLMLAVVMESYIISEIQENARLSEKIDHEEKVLHKRVSQSEKYRLSKINISQIQEQTTNVDLLSTSKQVEESQVIVGQEDSMQQMLKPAFGKTDKKIDAQIQLAQGVQQIDEEENKVEESLSDKNECLKSEISVDQTNKEMLTTIQLQYKKQDKIKNRLDNAIRKKALNMNRDNIMDAFEKGIDDGCEDDKIARDLKQKFYSKVKSAIYADDDKQMDDFKIQIQQEKQLLQMKMKTSKMKLETVSQQKYGISGEEVNVSKMRSFMDSAIKDNQNQTKQEEEQETGKQFQLLMNNKDKDYSFQQKRTTLAFGAQSSLMEAAIKLKIEREEKQKEQDENAEVTEDQKIEKEKNLDNIVSSIQQKMSEKNQEKGDLKRVKALKLIAVPLHNKEDQVLAIAEEGIQIINREKAFMRAQNNKLYRHCLILIKHNAFSFFISLCIIVNTGTLALEKYPINMHQETVIEYANLAFYTVFLAEMILKVLGLGCKLYLNQAENIFDMGIVILSTIDLLIFIYTKIEESNGREVNLQGVLHIMQVFRIFRLLRVFKLARSWESFNFFLKTIGNTMVKVSSFTILLALFCFMYAMLGMELFAHQVRFDRDGKRVGYFDPLSSTTSKKFSRPDSNFDTFGNALLSVFIVMANDGWTVLYFDHYRTVGPLTSSAFFTSLVILGQMILFNLFLAILLKEFEQNRKPANQENKKDESEKKAKIPFCKRLLNCTKNRTMKYPTAEKIDDQQQENVQGQGQGGQLVEEQENKSLYLFSNTQAFRIFCIKISESHWFENFILLMISISSVALAFENPLNDPEGRMVFALKILDFVSTAIFTIEVFVKVVARGFYFNGQNSYIRQVWNVIDFLIVVMSIISLFPLEINLTTLKIVRMARLLRPLRLISKNDSLKTSIQALVVSVPSIASLMVIVFFIMFVFAIVGVNLLKGKSFYCNTENLHGIISAEEIEEFINDREDCWNYGGQWRKKHYNFDNIQSSLTQILIMSQTVSWPITMYSAVNSRGPLLVPGYKVSSPLALFFTVFIIIGAFFINNLFVGVVINAFQDEIDHMGKDFMLSNEQKAWVETKTLTLKCRPKIALIRPKDNKLRQFFYDVAVHNSFEGAILVVIFLNTCLMTVKWAGISAQAEEITETINYIFSAIFVLEAAIKLIAFGSRYFRDSWNVFDFLIIVTSSLFITIKVVFQVDLGSTAQAVRTLRLGRISKLFRSMRQLQIIFQTMMNTLSSLANVGMLLVLCIYIFTVIGITLFADVKWQEPLESRLNFTNPFNAFFTLIITATGESYNDIMFVLGEGNSEYSRCISEPTYADYKQAGRPVGCGNYVLSYAFFGSYVVLVSFVFLNLFVAIILFGYVDTRDQENQKMNSDMLGIFQDAWSAFDPDATGYMNIQYFSDFMFELKPPLGWSEAFRDNPKRQEQFFQTIMGDLKTYKHNKQVLFHDVLAKLSMQYIIRLEVKNALLNLVKNNESEQSSSKMDGSDLEDSLVQILEMNESSKSSSYCSSEILPKKKLSGNTKKGSLKKRNTIAIVHRYIESVKGASQVTESAMVQEMLKSQHQAHSGIKENDSQGTLSKNNVPTMFQSIKLGQGQKDQTNTVQADTVEKNIDGSVNELEFPIDVKTVSDNYHLSQQPILEQFALEKSSSSETGQISSSSVAEKTDSNSGNRNYELLKNEQEKIETTQISEIGINFQEKKKDVEIDHQQRMRNFNPNLNLLLK